MQHNDSAPEPLYSLLTLRQDISLPVLSTHSSCQAERDRRTSSEPWAPSNGDPECEIVPSPTRPVRGRLEPLPQIRVRPAERRTASEQLAPSNGDTENDDVPLNQPSPTKHVRGRLKPLPQIRVRPDRLQRLPPAPENSSKDDQQSFCEDTSFLSPSSAPMDSPASGNNMPLKLPQQQWILSRDFAVSLPAMIQTCEDSCDWPTSSSAKPSTFVLQAERPCPRASRAGKSQLATKTSYKELLCRRWSCSSKELRVYA